jgi:hypothetical protein
MYGQRNVKKVCSWFKQKYPLKCSLFDEATEERVSVAKHLLFVINEHPTSTVYM